MSLEFVLSSNIQDGNTALHSACYRGWYSVVKLLIDAHADLGIANKVSITKPMTSVTARIPMQHMEPLCNASTDRYVSYGNISLSSSLSLTIFPLPSPLLSRWLCQGCHSLRFFGNAPIFDDPSDEPTDFYRGESVRNFFLWAFVCMNDAALCVFVYVCVELDRCRWTAVLRGARHARCM